MTDIKIGDIVRVWLGQGASRLGRVVEIDQDGDMFRVRWVYYPHLADGWVTLDELM